MIPIGLRWKMRFSVGGLCSRYDGHTLMVSKLNRACLCFSVRATLASTLLQKVRVVIAACMAGECLLDISYTRLFKNKFAISINKMRLDQLCVMGLSLCHLNARALSCSSLTPLRVIPSSCRSVLYGAWLVGVWYQLLAYWEELLLDVFFSRS